MDCFRLWWSLFDWACFSILLILGVYVMFRCSVLKEAVPRLFPAIGEPRCLEQLMINCVLNLVVRLWQVSSVTVFVWMRLIFHSFDFACSRDVPFRKRTFRSSSQEYVNPGGSSSQWLAPFWIFEFALDLFRLWRSLFECAWFSILLILLVHVMFRSKRGRSESPPRNGLTLVARAVNN